MANNFLDQNGVLYLWQKIINKFVSKEPGKGLSANDYTADDKNKLSNLPGITSIGAGLELTDGKLSATGGGVADSVNWEDVQNVPAGQANGIATLDANGVVPSSQLPSYVDDIIEGFYYNDAFYSDDRHANVVAGEIGKIYVDLDTNISYRYGGSTYVQITSSDMVPITNAQIDSIVSTT